MDSVDIIPLCEYGLCLQWRRAPDFETLQHVRQVADLFQMHPITGQLDVAPANHTVTVFFDPMKYDTSTGISPLQSAIRQIQSRLAATPSSPSIGAPGREHTIAVRYTGRDLSELCDRLALSTAEIIAWHSQPCYTVFMIGFLPGFPYLGVLPEVLKVSRKSTPARMTPAGSVAIAGLQTGIYPQASPGGWWVLGYTEFPLFRPDQLPPAILQPGDQVRFIPV